MFFSHGLICKSRDLLHAVTTSSLGTPAYNLAIINSCAFPSFSLSPKVITTKGNAAHRVIKRT